MANAGTNARLNANRIRMDKVICAVVFKGDKGKKTGEENAVLNLSSHSLFHRPIPDKSSIASSTQHVKEET